MIVSSEPKNEFKCILTQAHADILIQLEGSHL